MRSGRGVTRILLLILLILVIIGIVIVLNIVGGATQTTVIK
jgi:hypothetical protein